MTPNNTQEMAKRLYQRMPGAPFPPIEDGEYLWGEIENEHWDFCEAIAELIAAVAAREASP